MGKIYVITEYEYLKNERYVTVKTNRDEAKEFVFENYENVKESKTKRNPKQFLGRNRNGKTCFIYIHEEVI